MTGLVLVALVVSLGGWWWARREVRAMRRDVARLQEDMRRATSLEEVYRAERGAVPPSRALRRVKVVAPMVVGAEMVRRYPVPATAVAAVSVLGGAALLLSEPDPGTQILPGRAGPAPAVAAPAWDGQPDRPGSDREPEPEDDPDPEPEREPATDPEPSPGEVAMADDPEPPIDPEPVLVAEPEIEAGAEVELPSETDVELPGVEAPSTAVPTTTTVAEPKPELKLEQRCLVELDVHRLRLCV